MSCTLTESTPISVEPKKVSLGSFCSQALDSIKKTVSNTTIHDYSKTKDRLINYFGDHRNLKTIATKDIELFLSELVLLEDNGEPSDSTRAKHLRNGKRLFNIAVKWKYIRSNPFTGIPIGKIAKKPWHYITPDEFKSLLEHTPDLRNKVFYSVMYGCGLRFGEAVHLMWNKNIDLINKTIILSNRTSPSSLPPFTLKDFESRCIPCPDKVIELLKELKEQSSSSNPYVVLSDRRLELIKKKWKQWKEDGKASSWLNTTMVNNTHRKFSTYCQKAKISTSDRLSVHCLRKAYGTNLANAFTPIHTLKDLMGHSNIQTTMEYYIHCSDENKKKAIEKLNGLMG